MRCENAQPHSLYFFFFYFTSFFLVLHVISFTFYHQYVVMCNCMSQLHTQAHHALWLLLWLGEAITSKTQNILLHVSFL